MTISYPPLPSILGISPHGIFTMVGIAVGAFLLLREVRRRGGEVDVIESALIWAVPVAIVGARVDYVISHPGDFTSFWQLLEIWRGGLALFGGLIAGVGVGAVVAYRGGYHLPRLLDVTARSLAISVAVGRVGDILLLDHLGKPVGSGLALAYRIQAGSQLAPGFEPSPAIAPPNTASCTDLGSYYAGCSYHLSAAYDLVGALLLFVLLMLMRRYVDYRAGVAISVWAAWYGLQRFVLDYTRGIDERPVLGLTGTQMLAFLLAMVGLFSLLVVQTRGTGWGDADVAAPSRQAPLLRTSLLDHG